ncbi:hypothetical protein X777_07193 [Ooceraea biroi]|uniref:Uncharacterized protein n=1 Tax=Ooceraea biroi TaxID=2015173 RepID=A0A026WAD4_OOCBI|nr:hypothetical protein X777_07193 [Ooceraea biroi]
MDYAMVIRVKKPSFYTRKCFEARKIVELSDPKAVNHVEDERLFLSVSKYSEPTQRYVQEAIMLLAQWYRSGNVRNCSFLLFISRRRQAINTTAAYRLTLSCIILGEIFGEQEMLFDVGH